MQNKRPSQHAVCILPGLLVPAEGGLARGIVAARSIGLVPGDMSGYPVANHLGQNTADPAAVAVSLLRTFQRSAQV